MGNQYGRPAKMMSDDALYFNSAANMLDEQHDNVNALSPEFEEAKKRTKVEWIFNPPYSPHKGADWERNLKSVKQLLNKHLQPQKQPTIKDPEKAENYWPMNINTFRNTLIHIAAVMNSRPLHAPDGTGLNIDRFISPARLVLGVDILPAPSGLDKCIRTCKDGDVRDMMEYKDKIVDAFWKEFMETYIPSLQKAHKWQEPQINIKLGQIVLVKPIQTVGLKRPYWKMGRVTKIRKDRKDLVRTIHVFMQIRHTKAGARIINTVVAMPVQHCVPLELQAPATNEPHWTADMDPDKNLQSPSGLTPPEKHTKEPKEPEIDPDTGLPMPEDTNTRRIPTQEDDDDDLMFSQEPTP